MTEEEKLLYMEQKRLAEEEMKKKKEDMLTQFLKVSYCRLMFNDTKPDIIKLTCMSALSLSIHKKVF